MCASSRGWKGDRGRPGSHAPPPPWLTKHLQFSQTGGLERSTAGVEQGGAGDEPCGPAKAHRPSGFSCSECRRPFALRAASR